MTRLVETKGEQIFTHFDELTGKQTTFASQKLSNWCKTSGIKPVKIPFSKEFVTLCFARRGIEEHRLARLTPAQLDEPILFCQMPEGSWLLVDGTHRYVRSYLEGAKTCQGWMLEERLWRPFQVADPQKFDQDELLNSFSGLK